jgi:anti-anti-sigma factor
MALEITTVLADSVAEITLSGELDATSAPRFQQELEAAAAGRPTRLVLHVEGLCYMASAGIRMLIFAKQRLGLALDVYVVAPQEPVLETLRRTGLHHSVLIVDRYPPSTI